MIQGLSANPVSPASAITSMRYVDWSSLHYHLSWAYDGPAPKVALSGTYTNYETSCWLLRKGSVVLKSPGQSAVTVRPGQWVFIASPTRHQSFSADAELLSVHFLLTWPGGEPVVNRQKNMIIDADKIPRLEKAAMPIVRMLARRFPDAGAFLLSVHCSREFYLRVQALLAPWLNAYLDVQELLGNPPTLRAGRDERVLRAAAMLDRMPFAQPVFPEAMAGNLGVSRSHLEALFTSQLGVTPRRYLEQRRFREAGQMLKRTGRSVKEVAAELGFRQASHFCMWFRKLSGKGPSEFRRIYGGNLK